MQNATTHTLQLQPNALLAGAILDEYRDLLNGPQTRQGQALHADKTSSQNCPAGKTSSQNCPNTAFSCVESGERWTVMSWTELPRA